MVIKTKIAKHLHAAQTHPFPLPLPGCWTVFSTPKNTFQGQAVDRDDAVTLFKFLCHLRIKSAHFLTDLKFKSAHLDF
jgi:hypothetical protein